VALTGWGVGVGVGVGFAVGFGVAGVGVAFVGLGVAVGFSVCEGVDAGVEPGVRVGWPVGGSVAGATGVPLGFCAVIVLEGATDAGGLAETAASLPDGVTLEGGVSGAPLDGWVEALGVAWGSADGLGSTAVIGDPDGVAVRGPAGIPNAPTANATVARARFRIPRATTRRARWAADTAMRDSLGSRHGSPSGVPRGSSDGTPGSIPSAAAGGGLGAARGFQDHRQRAPNGASCSGT
jgi:hypothetical protein